jgi:serine/threonine protein kinase
MALTLDEFVSVARESRLLKPDLLDSMLGEVGATGSIHDSHALASRLVGQGVLTHWQSEKLLGGVSSGFFLGKYKLQRLIASGSMSSVYEAEHTLLRKRVALKVLPKALVEEASFLERFYREARAVVRLDHPNIIRGFDVGQEGDYHYFVMEYLDGMSFQDLVEKSGPMSADVTAGMIKQAALGLEHAHEAGMVHRDIKPANLLLAEDGVVKVLDLGLVRSRRQEIDGEAGLTRIHDERMLGTVDYLSPEQAIDSHNVDIRSDVYSLGCTFYFLLAGDPPFAKGTLTERLLAHQTRSAIPISVIRPDVPASLGRIISKMLEKRPDSRYQTPAEVARALEEWIHRPAETVHVIASDASKVMPWYATPKRDDGGNREGVPVRAANLAGSATRVASSTASRSSTLVLDEPTPSNLSARSNPSSSVIAGGESRLESQVSPTLLVRRGLWEPWNQWLKAVESLASNAPLRMTPNDPAYRAMYESLMLACRDIREDAPESSQKLAREIRDMTSPWMNLQSLKSILQSEMKSSILEGVRDLDKLIMGSREPDSQSKKPVYPLAMVFLFVVAATLIGAAVLFLGPEPSESETSQSWVAQARLNLKRQFFSISDKTASH